MNREPNTVLLQTRASFVWRRNNTNNFDILSLPQQVSLRNINSTITELTRNQELNRLYGRGAHEFLNGDQEFNVPLQQSVEQQLNMLFEQHVEPPSLPPKSVIDGLQVVEVPANHEPCSVCLGGFDHDKDAKSIAIKLPCGHEFHPDCIKTWLGEDYRCPVCRYELPLNENKRTDSTMVENAHRPCPPVIDIDIWNQLPIEIQDELLFQQADNISFGGGTDIN